MVVLQPARHMRKRFSLNRRLRDVRLRMLPAPEIVLGHAQPSGESVATSCQFGFGEATSRAKVHTSVTCRTALMSPSMTLPALSRTAVTEFADEANGHMRNAVSQVSVYDVSGVYADKA